MAPESPTSSSGPAELFDVVVIGAGISGLTTAYWLSRAGMKVVVLESSDHVGGAITTHRDGPWLFELGPNTVLEGNAAVGELIRSCGLDDEKIEALPTAKKRFLWKGDRLIPLPGGPVGFVTTPLFPIAAKLRLLREPWIPRPVEDDDESIASFVRRRLGQTFLDYAVGPFVSGVYAGDPERLSVRWATPKIASLEREHGSLIRGAFARKKGLAGAPSGKMISFREGLDRLPKRLAERIGDVRTGVRATRILRGDAGPVVETPAGRFHSRHTILAVPADVAARLVTDATGGAIFGEIPYSPIAIVSLGVRRENLTHPLGGFGFLAPRRESLRVLGCLFPSEIFEGRAPEGHVALSAFLGGRTNAEVADWDDAKVLATALEDVRRSLGLRGDPVLSVVHRWPRALPQYELGHGRFVEAAAKIEAGWKGLHFGGNILRGVSVPQCIENGAALAREILTRWGEPIGLPKPGAEPPMAATNRSLGR